MKLHTGIMLNNTYFFYRQANWRHLCSQVIFSRIYLWTLIRSKPIFCSFWLYSKFSVYLMQLTMYLILFWFANSICVHNASVILQFYWFAILFRWISSRLFEVIISIVTKYSTGKSWHCNFFFSSKNQWAVVFSNVDDFCFATLCSYWQGWNWIIVKHYWEKCRSELL